MLDLLYTVIFYFGFFSLFTYIVPLFFFKTFRVQNLQSKYNATWALVTGGSSGIGLSIVKKLAKQNINVVVVALDDELLKNSEKELKSEFSTVEFKFVGVNLGAQNPEDYMIPMVKATEGLDVNLVFNNAGYIQVGLFSFTDSKQISANINCNAISGVNITHHFSKEMIKKNLPGLISFTSSPGGFMGSPMASLYSSTKSFLTSFASSIAGELKDENIDVVVVHPSPTNTGFYKNAGLLTALKFFQSTATDPSVIADSIFKSAGRCVIVDQGYYTILNRIFLKFFDVTVMTELMTAFVNGQNKNFYDDDNKLQQNVLETTKKFHTTNYKTILPLKQRRVSNLDCSHIKHTCLISNLYYINKSFKVYVGKNFNRSEISYLQDVRILTGIGHGSHSFRLNFILEKSNLTTVALPTTTSIISEKQPLFNQIEQKKKLNNTVTVDGHEIPTKKKFNLLENTSKQYEIDVFLEDPPESFNLPDDTEYVMEPTSFFSVLWSNLFRTIYSGVGAWYTQMYYNVFFLDHHRFVLIDNDPHPTKFLAVLSVVTKFPVEFLDSINNTIFRAGVMGISKDVQVAEIDDEIYFEERFELRKKVFRDFCDHLKEKILNFEDFENYGHKIFHKIVKKIRKNKKQSLQLLNFQKKKYNNNSSSSNVLQLSLILREGETRKILNEDGLIEMLKTFSEFEVNIYRFSQLTLQKQIEIIDQTDVFITMHGAALTHLLFLKKNSFVVELFPYAFKKKIYSNLSKILSLNYLSWQNSDIKKSVLNFDIVKNNRLTFMPKKLIMQLPINWFNMDSKNYWRNQDTLINLDEVKYILKNNLLETFKNKNQNSDVRYFIYLPWEQLNNQIIGLKSACAISNFLNRTLVIPDLGFRNPNSNTHKKLPSDFVFYKPADYIWKNIDRYLNSTNLLSLPCKQISLQNFKSLNKDLSINNIMYNHLSDETTSINQVKDYFQHVLKLKFNDIVFNPSIYYQLTKQEIFNFYGNNNQRVLAVSSMFWHYDFGYKQVFPLKNFHNYLHYGNENENLVVSDNLYEQISVGITYSERLMDLGGRLIKNIFKDVEEMNHQEYLSIHIRSGDYLEKCSKIFENLSCFINSTALIMENIEKHFDGHLINGGILYISTNEENFREVFKDLHVDFGGKFKKVLFLEDLLEDSEVDEGIEDNINLFDDNNKTINEIKDLVYEQDEEEKFGELPLRMDLDKLDQSILDQIICVNSKGFIGNYHSSFSRSIIENRIFKNKSWNVF